MQWSAGHGWQPAAPGALPGAQWVLVFSGARALDAERYQDIRRNYPQAVVTGCSTAGEICGPRVDDDSIVVTAVEFEHTTVRLARASADGPAASFAAGESLARWLLAEDLVHVLVLSDGLQVNGSELTKGLKSGLGDKVAVTGGLASDGALFRYTWVIADAPPAGGAIAAIGFYGDRLKVGYGSLGGWDPFGPDRLITRSRNNVLFELDHQPALDLYRRYLGEYAAGLPATGLLFPLALRHRDGRDLGIVRTILGVDERQGSMTFAGDMPEGMYARLMKANFDRLIDGAAGAAKAGHEALGGSQAALAVLISCVGRKLVLKQRVEEEVESVREVLGEQAILAGFYSYGEISPHTPTARCELHNQTMTVTTFNEV